MNETKEKGQIVREGMGGFLNPPGHPEHSYSVETDLHRPANDRSAMSLSAAVDCEWLDDATRQAARDILARWRENDRLCLGLPEVKDWIQQVLGYFKGCYSNPEIDGPEAWHADKLQINAKANPMAFSYCHAGVHLIRKYYPEYEPTAEDFAEAYWGRKTEKV
jgi:hypothetical protein